MHSNWKGSVLCDIASAIAITPHELRRQRLNFNVLGFGWHFSYFGNPAAIKKKLDAIAVVEKLTAVLDLSVTEIEDKIKKGQDIYGRQNVDQVILQSNVLPDDISQLLSQYLPETCTPPRISPSLPVAG